MTRTQRNKSEVNTKFKAAVPSGNGTIFYQFVPATEAEFTSKSSKKNDKEVSRISEPETSCSSPETTNSQNSEFSYYQEPNDNVDNLELNLNQLYQPYCNLQLEENPATTNIGEFIIDESVDLYLQDFYLNYFNYGNIQNS